MGTASDRPLEGFEKCSAAAFLGFPSRRQCLDHSPDSSVQVWHQIIRPSLKKLEAGSCTDPLYPCQMSFDPDLFGGFLWCYIKTQRNANPLRQWFQTANYPMGMFKYVKCQRVAPMGWIKLLHLSVRSRRSLWGLAIIQIVLRPPVWKRLRHRQPTANDMDLDLRRQRNHGEKWREWNAQAKYSLLLSCPQGLLNKNG